MTDCLAERDVTCARCSGDGYVTSAGVDAAVASMCDHLKSCAGCRGSGFVDGVDEAGYEFRAPCARRGLERRIGLFDAAGMPARYHDVTIESFEARGGNQAFLRATFGELRDTFEAGNRGVGLSGPPGVGKTHLLSALARYLLLERGMRLRYFEFARLLSDLKAGFDSGRSEAQLIRPLVSIDVLLIDELGKGRGSEWEIGVLDEIVGERYNRGLSTFYATNFRVDGSVDVSWNAPHRQVSGSAPAQTLAERLGPRIWSRLTEMCQPLPIDGPDARSSR